MFAGLKLLGAAACAVLILWAQAEVWKRPVRRQRIGFTLISFLALLVAFALVVSARCDLGWLPAGEC